MKALHQRTAPKSHGVTTLLALLISITAWSFGYAETRYVSQSGTHMAPFTSWETAATNIQGAVDEAVHGDTVLVTNGTYVLSSPIWVTKGITVVSVSGSEFTIVDGNYSTVCLSLNHSNAVVDGFTMTRGDGVGVSCGDGTVQNCIIGNTGLVCFYDCGSAGVFVDKGMVQNCTIIGNRGFGVQTPGIGGYGAPIDCTIRNCTIIGNGWTGVECEDEGVKVQNCMIIGNGWDGEGGGSGLSCFRGEVENCTIIGNGFGGGYGVSFHSSGTMQNCIIYGNPNGNIGSTEEWSFSYCCTTPAVPGEGNITNDPQFVDAAASDFRLSAMSPCIDAGANQPWMVGATDLDGTPRIIGATVDMGAYEWPHMVSFVDIKANGSDDLVVLGRGELLTVTASLVADPAIVGDTWILALTSQAYPFNFFAHDLNRNSWVPWLYSLYSPSTQGPIPHLQSETLLQSNRLPDGFYTFYLGYDPVQNRWIDFDTLEIDAVPVFIGN